MAATDGKLDVNLYFLWSPGDTSFAIDKDVLQELAQRLGAVARSQQAPIKLRASWLERRRLEALIARHHMLVRKYFSGDFGGGDDRPALARQGRRRPPQIARGALPRSHPAGREGGRGLGQPRKEIRHQSRPRMAGTRLFRHPLDRQRDFSGRDLPRHDPRDLRRAGQRRRPGHGGAGPRKPREGQGAHPQIQEHRPPQGAAARKVEVLPRLEASLNSARAKGSRSTGTSATTPRSTPTPTFSTNWSTSWSPTRSPGSSATTKNASWSPCAPPCPTTSRRTCSASGPARATPTCGSVSRTAGRGCPASSRKRFSICSIRPIPRGWVSASPSCGKNLRDFGGDIIETGMPGQGARFELFLPFSRST